jgi:acyl-homoserine-lactone acylase
MRHRYAWCAIVVALSLVATSADAARDRDEQRGGAQQPGEILWDTYGIPHIYGPDLLTVVRGYGYAQMENQAETMLLKFASARGRSAEYFGAGAGGANVTSDVTTRTEGIPDRAAAWLREGGQFQRAVVAAFVAGANEYAARHGDTIAPALRQVLPLVPTDVLAAEQQAIQFTFMPAQDRVPDLVAAWQKGGLAAANALASGFTPEGSNGWALAPRKSASGNAILMGNPHLPWGNNQPVPGLGVFQWMEANLVIGPPGSPYLNASGVAFVGAPFIGIGYSDYVGWTHTNNTIKNVDLYELTLTAGGGYSFGGSVRPLQHRQDAIKIRQADGSLVSQAIDVVSSIHGPVIAQSGGKALALRVAGLDAPSLVTQYWGMIAARNLPEFIAANAQLQMPFFNVIYADRQGQIMYLFGGKQPVRRGGTWKDYAGILPGDDPKALWTDTFPWWALPRTIDPPGGFVQNSNDPPWTSTFPETIDRASYPAYVAPDFMAPRPQNGALYLLSIPRLTADQVLAGKESTHMVLADRVLPDLIAAANASGNAVAQQAAAVLAAWDRNADASSRGAVLFERWYNTAVADPAMPKDGTISFYQPYPRFRIGWSAAQPLSTPQGLADPARAVLDLVAAAQAVQTAYGALDIAWGTVHRTVLVTHDPSFQNEIPVSNDPVSGPDDQYGGLRVVNPFPAQDGTSNLWSYGGDSYVQVVEFAPDGAHARSLLGYGNASRPGSPHITDQLPFFDAKTLRPALRTRADVERNTVSREQF